MYKAYQVGSNKVEISLLQFADDTIFLGEADMENVKTIKAVLRSFELVSGLKINFAKSSFGAFGQTDLWKQQAATYLNCQLLVLPFNYLGIPIGAKSLCFHVSFHGSKIQGILAGLPYLWGL